MSSLKILFVVICFVTLVVLTQGALATSAALNAIDISSLTERNENQATPKVPCNAVPLQSAKPANVAKTRNVAIVLYEGVELLDFAGPGEVFTQAQNSNGEAAFNVYTVGKSTEPLLSQGFLTIKPQYSFENAPKPDIVVFPGGEVKGLLNDKAGMIWAKATAQEAEIAMSVCNGAHILADARLLDNKNITSHWGAIPTLRKKVPSATVLENIRFVDNGQIITTAGVSAGIDGALHVVERLLGTQSAVAAARIMEYNWQPKK